MFSAEERLDSAYQSAQELKIDQHSRIVLMSDCHRGSGSSADDFAKNKLICHAALQYYNSQHYTYIELGDGDELWENKSFAEIVAVHRDIFELLSQFNNDKRLYMLYGNHDLAKKNKKDIPLLTGLVALPGIRLKYTPTGGELFLVHGHQADFFNDTLWRLAQFLVRHIWKPLELIGFNNPTSAAKNNKVKDKVEKNLKAWTEQWHIPLIAGHTHRPVFPQPGEGLYFNDGSCVHPWSITALEISQANISLVKWSEKTKPDGTLHIAKDTLTGPTHLTDYFPTTPIVGYAVLSVPHPAAADVSPLTTK